MSEDPGAVTGDGAGANDLHRHAFAAMGTRWEIWCDRPELFVRTEGIVRAAEARLSRFVPDSALRRLARDGSVDDAVVARLVERALAFSAATGGAFDILLGRELVNLGYDRTYEELAERGPGPTGRVGPSEVRVERNLVTVEGPAWVDLSGIARGWTIDKVHDILVASGARAVLVEAGGDARGTGRPWVREVSGRSVVLDGGAVATSSTLRRQWPGPDGLRHAVVDPRTGDAARGPVVTATVCAPDAITADVLATALIVDPSGVVPLLASFRATAAVRSAAGIWSEVG